MPHPVFSRSFFSPSGFQCVHFEQSVRQYLHRSVAAGLLGLVMLTGGLGMAADVPAPVPTQETSVSTPPSILRPQSGFSTMYRFPLDAVDPVAATNPKGAASPGIRGENQLVIYTPASGSSTHTNEAGTEAIVSNGIVRQLGTADSVIPADGMVISGHGAAAAWMARFVLPGALAELDTEGHQLVIRWTPSVYLNQVDVALQRAASRTPADEPAYERALAQAKDCRTRLQVMADANADVQPAMATLAGQCQADADRAFYATIAARPEEFRGAWIRPDSLDPARIRKVIDSLKALKVQNVFLETYYQGETIFPSEVMATYGLPVQHPQFKGGDPLALWIQVAHEAGLKVHVWTQVFFAGNAQENAETFGPILQKYPQWRNVERAHLADKTPVPSDIEPGHYFLDPANAEVRTFLQKLIAEIVTRYDVDGLNLDYIRYPASAAVSKSIYLSTTWGYTDTARQQFGAFIDQDRQADTGKKIEALKKAGKPVPKALTVKPAPPDAKDLTPSSPLWPQWLAWRKEQVSTFVKAVSEQSHAVKPNLLISAVVFPSHDPTYALKLQDYPRWAREGYIQALTPIGLSPRPDWLVNQARMLKEQVQDKVPVYVGIFGMYNRATPIELVSQVEAVHEANMPGVVFFDWARLTPAYQEALQTGPLRE